MNKLIYSEASHEIIATTDDVENERELVPLARYILDQFEADAADYASLCIVEAEDSLMTALRSVGFRQPRPAFKVSHGVASLA